MSVLVAKSPSFVLFLQDYLGSSWPFVFHVYFKNPLTNLDTYACTHVPINPVRILIGIVFHLCIF